MKQSRLPLFLLTLLLLARGVEPKQTVSPPRNGLVPNTTNAPTGVQSPSSPSVASKWMIVTLLVVVIFLLSIVCFLIFRLQRNTQSLAARGVPLPTFDDEKCAGVRTPLLRMEITEPPPPAPRPPPLSNERSQSGSLDPTKPEYFQLRGILLANPDWDTDEFFAHHPDKRWSVDNPRGVTHEAVSRMISEIQAERAERRRPSSPGYISESSVNRELSAPSFGHVVDPTASISNVSCVDGVGRTSSSQRNDPTYSMVTKKWQKYKLLGSGSFGEVWQGIRPNGTFFAVKVLRLNDNMNESDIKKLMAEVHTMSEMPPNPSLVQYFGCTFDKAEQQLSIFMEFVEGGSVGALVRKLPEPLTEMTAQQYIKQVINGVSFLHARNIIHRDLKGDNILISHSEGVKLADFGTCKQLKDIHETAGGVDQARTMIGTPLWMAPEVIKGDGDGYGRSADIWSVGCCLVEMLNRGNPPWPPFANNWKAIITIGRWTEPLPPKIPEGLSPGCMEFLRCCFNPDPDKRSTADELLQHPYLATEPTMQPAEQYSPDELTQIIIERRSEKTRQLHAELANVPGTQPIRPMKRGEANQFLSTVHSVTSFDDDSISGSRAPGKVPQHIASPEEVESLEDTSSTGTSPAERGQCFSPVYATSIEDTDYSKHIELVSTIDDDRFAPERVDTMESEDVDVSHPSLPARQGGRALSIEVTDLSHRQRDDGMSKVSDSSIVDYRNSGLSTSPLRASLGRRTSPSDILQASRISNNGSLLGNSSRSEHLRLKTSLGSNAPQIHAL